MCLFFKNVCACVRACMCVCVCVYACALICAYNRQVGNKMPPANQQIEVAFDTGWAAEKGV